MADYRVLITGSRTWTDRTAVFGALDDLLRNHGTLTVVHGACPRGADEIAHEWLTRRYRVTDLGTATAEPHPADWNGYGKQAGFIRNAEMVALGADLCLAFIKSNSAGASHCATLAEKAGIPTRRLTDG